MGISGGGYICMALLLLTPTVPGGITNKHLGSREWSRVYIIEWIWVLVG